MRVARHCSRIFPYAACALLAFTLAACAPAPIYRTGAASVTATPAQVATSPANFRNLHVVWGGRVVWVHNYAHHSELEIFAYPLDGSQRPRLKQPAMGRFIATTPGFLEPMDYPKDALVTLEGTLDGIREGGIGEARYTFALVHSNAIHRWSAEQMRQGHPNVHIGIGVGGRIR